MFKNPKFRTEKQPILYCRVEKYGLELRITGENNRLSESRSVPAYAHSLSDFSIFAKESKLEDLLDIKDNRAMYVKIKKVKPFIIKEEGKEIIDIKKLKEAIENESNNN